MHRAVIVPWCHCTRLYLLSKSERPKICGKQKEQRDFIDWSIIIIILIIIIIILLLLLITNLQQQQQQQQEQEQEQKEEKLTAPRAYRF